MDPRYHIGDTSEIITPAVVLFVELLEQNLDKMVEIAGDTARLRPHCKTHKMAEVIRRELRKGIVKHKCATFAEAEMLARAGAKDIFLAYNLVGPNVKRAVRFVETFPDVLFSVTADHPGPIEQLGRAFADAGSTISVLLDIDTGLRRTGVEAGPYAKEIYRRIVDTPGLCAAGLHVYDGQQHQKSREDRAAAVHDEWRKVVAFRDELLAARL